MKTLLEIKINKFHYKRATAQDFWINQNPQDPLEVCATSGELASQLGDSTAHGMTILDKIKKRLKEIEKVVKILDKETEGKK